MRITSIAVRTVFFVGFLIALPVLALPSVAGLVDRLLYTDKPTVSPLPLAAAPSQQVVEPQLVEPTSPAQFDASLVSTPSSYTPVPEGGLDAASAPPPLNPLPQFMPSAVPQPQTTPVATPIDDVAMQRLQQVRQRLEDLGAKYIVLETTSGTSQYRFHCQMLLDERSTYTRDFNMTAAHPLEAAEGVLAQVEAWRTASRSANTRF